MEKRGPCDTQVAVSGAFSLPSGRTRFRDSIALVFLRFSGVPLDGQ
jgi:hypothetical protein